MSGQDKNIRIVTRSSPLALWQSRYVSKAILQLHKKNCDLIEIITDGDRWLESSLAKIGGKGLFVKALEEMLISGDADLAVHSLKDLPTTLPDGLTIGAILPRENPTDAFVSNHFSSFESLLKGAVVGTSSLRRSSQILHARPDLKIKLLRGNVNTRLSKLDEGQYDAIILATAGLIRLGFEDRICHEMPLDISLPSASQGVLALECSQKRNDILNLLLPLNHTQTYLRILAEREVVDVLQGGCHAPVASFATFSKDSSDSIELSLTARVISHDGTMMLEEQASIALSNYDTPISIQCAKSLGKSIAQSLISRGAQQIISESIDFIAKQP